MRKTLAVISVISLFFILNSYGQQRDTTRHKDTETHRMNRFIRQHLNVDSVKAEQVAEIQSAYKTGLAAISANGALTEAQKRRAADSLVRIKNNSLSAILTPEQQEKIIPSTEHKKNVQQGNQRP